eukprot:scaffold175810_cov33-Tisochrysis_lutea.AAC.1
MGSTRMEQVAAWHSAFAEDMSSAPAQTEEAGLGQMAVAPSQKCPLESLSLSARYAAWLRLRMGRYPECIMSLEERKKLPSARRFASIAIDAMASQCISALTPRAMLAAPA